MKRKMIMNGIIDPEIALMISILKKVGATGGGIEMTPGARVNCVSSLDPEIICDCTRNSGAIIITTFRITDSAAVPRMPRRIEPGTRLT
jgi:hypothetical protein